ncbi:phosphate ABC transporter permease PstA [Anaeromicropila herbilytica]|uniref:Phosphate transport system permease protein PstA n=1 Tax=Anaeromicropila herbilytica TaxID=2785025 RepID=A0A7R7EKP4_9FIRM|nr:phosphate ABC transporter permease PstA [Anaeromicropila herbilytica]BCN30346.1 phosphate transport system permease protein PstA [Anaeromicropila herbilytica]
MKESYNRAKIMNHIMTIVFYIVAGFFLLLLVSFAGYVIIHGFEGFHISLLSFDRNGIGNQLFNTIYLVFLSLFVSVPIGVLAGIYMAEYAKKNAFTTFIRICIETLSSLPSIVVGLFGYLVFILMTGSKWNLMAGAMAVSILTLPLICTVTEDALKSLPKEYKDGSFGVGATHWQTIIHVLIPASMKRIMTGVILAAGRGFGEAAVLLYTAGMSTDINWTNWNLSSPSCPLNPFRPGETLALHIWSSRTEAIMPNAAQIANFSSAILMILVFAFSIGARILGSHFDSNSSSRKETKIDKEPVQTLLQSKY